MINNMSREDLFKMLEHSALYFKNEFEMIDTKVNEKEEDYNANNESEWSESISNSKSPSSWKSNNIK